MNEPIKLIKQIKPVKQGEKPASNLKRSDLQASNEAKPLASLSLDLDNLWSYMKTHGDSGWESFPSYLDILIPMVLEIFDELNLKVTFFIVGQDAALDKNEKALKLITQHGHKVGNHSFHHEPWLHLYRKNKIQREIIETEEQIYRITEQKPIGFRGPGFSWSPSLLEVLIENNYVYDASTLPTYIGPLARLYYFWKSDLSAEEKIKRKKIFGTFNEGLRPIRPYYLQVKPEKKILEIPVTTMPIIKTPFHLSYLIYLSRFSKELMLSYLKISLFLCRITKTAPSFLLHPLDFLGYDKVTELKFFPGMDRESNQKVETFKKVILTLSKSFKLVNLNSHAEFLIKQNNPKVIKI